MQKLWSNSWKSSSQTRKQRKYRFNAPLHIKRKFLSAPLSKDLRSEYKTRSFKVRSGDTVIIKSGQFKGTTGKITKVSVTRTFVHVKGAVLKKSDGSEVFYPIHPSNVEIIKLNLDDKFRVSKLNKFKEGSK